MRGCMGAPGACVGVWASQAAPPAVKGAYEGVWARQAAPPAVEGACVG